MPQKDQSSRLGKSSSKIVNNVIQNNKGVQKPGTVPGILKQQHNKHPEPSKH